ncbi:hypothetical protein SK128_010421 [Halocaridina rubra]|uniref:Uncharacterized protein n=1 Tax=Halocaridina rubra TaxID=373956 RepID=A0AAN8WS63_HALRR
MSFGTNEQRKASLGQPTPMEAHNTTRSWRQENRNNSTPLDQDHIKNHPKSSVVIHKSTNKVKSSQIQLQKRLATSIDNNNFNSFAPRNSPCSVTTSQGPHHCPGARKIVTKALRWIKTTSKTTPNPPSLSTKQQTK